MTALAAGNGRDITVYPIKVIVNGEVFQPTDSSGKVVEVTYNGTTYAPRRALAEAYSLEVGYDSQRNIATVNRPKEDYIRVLYYNLLTQGKLFSHLADVEEQAQSMFERLTERIAKQQGVTEALKTADMMVWVGKMNCIYNVVGEIVRSNLIYR